MGQGAKTRARWESGGVNDYYYSVSGPGLTMLNRGAFQALGILNKFGGPTKEVLNII